MVERYPNLKEEVGGSILSCEISSILDGKFVKWSIASCDLAMKCRSYVSRRRKRKLLKKQLEISCSGLEVVIGLMGGCFVLA